MNAMNPKPMRPSLLHLAIFLLPAVASAAEPDTAYKALRVFGKQMGESVLNRVTEVRGRNGVPQPEVWKIVAADPAARGGIVEADVQRGRIISQRTPTSRGAISAPLDLNRLNLDSDGVFTVADQEMRKRTIPFDRLDYVLRSPGSGEPPMWQIDLSDRGEKVAVMRIAADSGTVLDIQRLAPARRQPASSGDRDYVDNRRGPAPRESRDRYEDDRWSESGERFRGPADFFHRLGKRFQRRGVQLKNFFTGGD
jgi:hypothetical protein